MLLDPRDPAAQAFIADHMADYPLDSFEEAARESNAFKCDDCESWFSSKEDFDTDAELYLCWGCSADRGGSVNPHREWGTYR